MFLEECNYFLSVCVKYKKVCKTNFDILKFKIFHPKSSVLKTTDKNDSPIPLKTLGVV